MQCFVLFFFFISFGCTIQWFYNAIHYLVCIKVSVLLIPFTYFTHPFPPTSPLVTICLFSIVKSLFFGFSLCCCCCSFVLFLQLHVWVKSYGISLSLTDLFHLSLYSLDPTMLLQMKCPLLFFYYVMSITLHCIISFWCSVPWFIVCI